MPDISKINALAIGSVAKVDGLAKASILDIDGVAVPSAFLLDTYTGAAAAYSVRKLDKDYTGSCMRVRRASDGAETDIGFDGNGDLDTAAIATHCGASTGWTVTWYDQSGNSNNATQSTAGDQPQIYNGTAVITENGKPAIKFALDFLDAPNFLDPTSNNIYTISGVATANAQDRMLFNLSDGTEIASWNYGRTAGVLAARTYDGSTVNDVSGAQTIDTQFLGFATHNFSTPITSLHLDSVQQTGTGVGRGVFDTHIGRGPLGANNDLVGLWQELIAWPSNQSSNRTGIESNINGYFSIYP